MKAIAPGKLVLSGEHSVVYGAPAIAVAVTSLVTATFSKSVSTELAIHSESLGEFSRNLATFKFFYEQLDERFGRFLQGQLAVSNVLSSPSDLLFYTLAQSNFAQSGKISIHSSIPTGAGMGSSAAVIAALLKLSEACDGDALSSRDFFKRVRYCERLQHGRGSAIDAAATTFGGMVKVQNDQVTLLPKNLDEHWYIWHSGSPSSTTGETVAEVREKFEFSSIWQNFEQVTVALEKALFSDNAEMIAELIQENQCLLEQIGVVPKTIANVIAKIVSMGASAKICGAGSSSGNAGGQVLIYAPLGNAIEIAQRLDINLQPLTISYQGAHIESD